MSDDKNPCTDERHMSLLCLDQNSGNKDSCKKQFENYNACKTFWMKVKMARLVNGKKPLLPDAEFRPAMKELFLQTGKIPFETAAEQAAKKVPPM